MREGRMKIKDAEVPVTWVHTLVIGSGAAGLNAAIQLRRHGVQDVLIVTEGLEKGPSINTGSDKQTYYKLGLCGYEADSPRLLADSLFSGGSMHGDLALVEASVSARAFLNLVELGVPFPQDRYGQFVGYKTDHDPRRRATSIGPYTSREMCRALIRAVRKDNIPIRENRVVVSLITTGNDENKRAAGALAITESGDLELYAAENVIFAVGGPGGLYEKSVYPNLHTGAIGLALMIGAKARNLNESQFGLASIGFRWNVSGTYMQAIPRFISTADDGKDEKEFLRDYFDSTAEMSTMVFLKGYQWPFDAQKIAAGSSIIDLLVTIEREVRSRRVFLDFTNNPENFDPNDLHPEALDYLTRSRGLQGSPIERLEAMNRPAARLFREHGVDLTFEPLEIAVCAQHNNGGLAANHWWESLNVKHLFPVGEVNGSHGVSRPGGTALNSGQVGGIRAAEYIAKRYQARTLDEEAFRRGACQVVANCPRASQTWPAERREFQRRMTKSAAHIRSADTLRGAVADAWRQWRRINSPPERGSSDHPGDWIETLRNRQLCFAHAVYLEAILFAVQSGLGSRGSAIALDSSGTIPHEKLKENWRFTPENPAFRDRALETAALTDTRVASQWGPCRPIPQSDLWFETAWSAFREGEIYC